MRLLVTNIKQLCGISRADCRRKIGPDMGADATIEDAYLIANGGVIIEYGKMNSLSSHAADEVIDATDRLVLPAFCDSHTHLVYAGSREREFEDKIRGLSYAQIAARGGGILNSAAKLHLASEDELFEQALPRLKAIMATGSGTVEIKSGYGLNTEDELKMLRVIRRLSQALPITVKATLLAAHALPKEYKKCPEEYVNMVCREMIPAVAQQSLAQFVDVFCEEGFFDVAKTEKILDCAARFGLFPKLHANQLHRSGGVELGVRKNALSVDHLESAYAEEIESLKDSVTMPTLLPGASFFLNMHYAHARKMIDSGLGVALASDMNPGSSPSGNMQFVMSLGCIMMRMTPAEALAATTINGAYAMGLGDRGSIALGKRADLIITKKIPSLAYIPYMYMDNAVDTMIINGKRINNEQL